MANEDRNPAPRCQFPRNVPLNTNCTAGTRVGGEWRARIARGGGDDRKRKIRQVRRFVSCVSGSRHFFSFSAVTFFSSGKKPGPGFFFRTILWPNTMRILVASLLLLALSCAANYAAAANATYSAVPNVFDSKRIAVSWSARGSEREKPQRRHRYLHLTSLLLPPPVGQGVAIRRQRDKGGREREVSSVGTENQLWCSKVESVSCPCHARSAQCISIQSSSLSLLMWSYKIIA